jgi:hypothetical protein
MGRWDQSWGRVEWIHLAQDKKRWRAVVSAVMNIRVLARRIYLEWDAQSLRIFIIVSVRTVA